EYASSGLPPLSVSIFGLTSANLTSPGPRYLESVRVTGGGVFRIGVLAPLVYLASSSAQRSSVSGVESVAVRVIDLATLATGPLSEGPRSTNLTMGGRLYSPVGPCSDDLNGLML